MDGWNTIVSFLEGLFSGAMLVSGRVFITSLILERGHLANSEGKGIRKRTPKMRNVSSMERRTYQNVWNLQHIQVTFNHMANFLQPPHDTS